MANDGIYPSVQAGISGIVNIATVKAVTDVTKSAFGTKKSYSKKSKSRKSKGFDIW